MTKVYLVCSRGCKATGAVDLKSNEEVVSAFTNKKLADNCVNYRNQEWRLGFARNADFKVEKLRYYYRKTMVINHTDYDKLPY